MTEFTIVGIGGAVLVALLVQVIKTIWPALDGSKWLIPVALGVGIALSVLAYVATIVPGVKTWVEVVFAGVMAGLVAMGLYSGAKKLTEK